MPEYNFQLRGWHGLIAIAVLLGYFGISLALRVRPVDDAMRAAVRGQLLNEYSGRGPKDLARIVAEARQGKPLENMPEMVQRDVQFTSVGAHGKLDGRIIYIRAEITVDGGPPPDGRPVRYFSISRKFGGGWMVNGESSSYTYYSLLFP
jgi:hypothetical protein